jgi:hypothetical protein
LNPVLQYYTYTLFTLLRTPFIRGFKLGKELLDNGFYPVLLAFISGWFGLFAMYCYQAVWSDNHFGAAVETAPDVIGNICLILEESYL